MVVLLLVVATSVHLGFQVVVTAVVYPALLTGPQDGWAQEHAAHSRRVTPVVVAVYGLLALACGAVLLVGPRSPASLVAVAACAVVVGVTALAAAPEHGRLGGSGWTPAGAGRLRRADVVRMAGALVAAAAAVVAALPTP